VSDSVHNALANKSRAISVCLVWRSICWCATTIAFLLEKANENRPIKRSWQMADVENKNCFPVLHVDDAPENVYHSGSHWGSTFQVLTPTMRDKGGKLGVNLNRLPQGRATCPFHYHILEDEVFYILSGRGVLRYGDELFELRAGHCIECPAGTKVAHQIGNPYPEDLVYLAIGNYEPNEVCYYPDSDKIMVRSLSHIGKKEKTDYMYDEPDEPPIFSLIKAHQSES
jgi:uncharacterized cupin superfamily protein